MATAIVSGRVDEVVKERAGAYIKAAGLTVGDVINIVWTNIANTGSIPTIESAGVEEALDPFERFMAFRETFNSAPIDERYASMTDEEILMEHLVEKYG